MTCADSLDHQAACDFSGSRTDIYDLVVDNICMGTIASSFVIAIICLCNHREHMIEQEGTLDKLGMLDFICFIKHPIFMVASLKNIEHDFRKNMKMFHIF